jgi:hypothetical protein
MDKNVSYTLIYKQNCKTCINSFISFDALKYFVEKCFKNCDVSNLKPVDKGLTIFYLENKGE